MTAKSIFTLAFGSFLLIACNKDPEQTGCADPVAINYEPGALKDDGSCQYNQAEQVIWQDGVFGGWNEDYHEGAYQLDVCVGTVREVVALEADSTESITLMLETDGGSNHRSVFSLINEHDARDFAEGSLRFDARLADSTGAAPEFIRLFISGKIPLENKNCDPYGRSTFVDISTRSFSDSTYSEVNVPLRHFSQVMMARINVVAGFEFEAERNVGIEINRLRWVANDRKE